MTEKPWIFCADMVRAILAGRKTMTRRIDGLDEINRDPDAWTLERFPESQGGPDYVYFRHKKTGKKLSIRCPYPVGQTRWVRETAWIYGKYERSISDDDRPSWVWNQWGEDVRFDNPSKVPMDQVGYHKRPSIYMPRWASRLSLRILDHDHRCQRLEEITEEDAIAEGVIGDEGPWDQPTASMCFSVLWDRLNGTRKGGMYAVERNPWVWPVKFERIK